MSLVEQLRNIRQSPEPYKNLSDLCSEAADEIERLRAALQHLSVILMFGANSDAEKLKIVKEELRRRIDFARDTIM